MLHIHYKQHHVHLHDAFKESEHPRVGKGKSGGGQFVKKGTGGGVGFSGISLWHTNKIEPTSNQVKALKWYSGDGFTRINPCLRKYGKCSERILEKIDIISSYLEKSEAPNDVKVYRAISSEKGVEYLKSLFGGEKVKKGDVFTDLGFVSTTTDPSRLVTNFNKFTLVINIKKGTKGAASIKANSYYPDEEEVLIDKESKFKIVDFDTKKEQTLFGDAVMKTPPKENKFVYSDLTGLTITKPDGTVINLGDPEQQDIRLKPKKKKDVHIHLKV